MSARLGTLAGVLALAGLAGACAHEEQPAPELGDGQPSQAVAAFLDTTRWIAWQGEGFTMRVPASGTEVQDAAGAAGIAGTTMSWWPDSSIPPFRISVEYRLHSMLPLRRYVDSVRMAYNRALDAESSQIEGFDATSVAGQQALDLMPWCRDCAMHEIYVPLDGRIVVFRYNLMEQIPILSEIQRMLYRGVLASVRAGAKAAP